MDDVIGLIINKYFIEDIVFVENIVYSNFYDVTLPSNNSKDACTSNNALVYTSNSICYKFYDADSAITHDEIAILASSNSKTYARIVV